MQVCDACDLHRGFMVLRAFAAASQRALPVGYNVGWDDASV